MRWAAASWEKVLSRRLAFSLGERNTSKGRRRGEAQRTCVISNWRLQRKHLTHGSSSFLSFTMETQWKNTRYKWPFLNETQEESEDFVPVTSDMLLNASFNLCNTWPWVSYSFYKNIDTGICPNNKTMNTTVKWINSSIN